MKTSQFIGAVVLSLLGVAAQAETYQGVQTVHSVRSRADVGADARVAARAGNVYGEGAAAGVTPLRVAGIDRATIRAGAVQTARLGNPYGEAASSGVLSVAAGQVDRSMVRAEARAAARANIAAL